MGLAILVEVAERRSPMNWQDLYEAFAALGYISLAIAYLLRLIVVY